MYNNREDERYLSCSEIFSDAVVEVKPAPPPHPPKLLLIRATVDKAMAEDERILPNLINNEERYLPGNPDYFRFIQVEVKPHMRKIVADWMLEVCQELGCQPEVFCLAMNYMDRFLAKCR